MMAIKNKLPRNVVLELLKMEKAQQVIWGVNQLREGITKIVTVREEAQRCTQALSLRNNQQKFNNYQDRNNQRNFNINKNNIKKFEPERFFSLPNNLNRKNFHKKEITCLFCQNTHLAGNCNKIKKYFSTNANTF